MKRLICLASFFTFGWIALAAEPPRPKLVLAVVVDQFRYDYLLRFRKDYNAGFARILEQGAVFHDAHHIHFPTVTAIGHSTVLSGATPSLSGIVGNEWFDRKEGEVTSVSDPTTKLVGAAGSGSSPRRLLVSTLGDELKMAGQHSKVIGISIKDRAAILPSGHMADAAYWFDAKSDQWVTSTYYQTALPAWAAAVNAEKPADKIAHSDWLPFDAAPGAKPFCNMGGTGATKCKSLEASPWGNEFIEAFAERALAEEKLGQHDATDVLTVSFSSNDYVGHQFGPDSAEVRDISIRTDRLLGKLLAYVDSRVGKGNTLFVLTADHGVAPVPEVQQSRKMPGGRLSLTDMEARMRAALAAKYGPGDWIAKRSGPVPYLNTELIQTKGLKEADVEQTAAEAIRAMPHIFRVYTRDEILSGHVRADAISAAVRNGFYPQRSGDLVVMPEPFYLFEGSGTSHGTPFNYDTHVPVIFMGTGVKAGNYYGKIAVNDIAPTLAAILGVQEPSGSVGRILSEMLQ